MSKQLLSDQAWRIPTKFVSQMLANIDCEHRITSLDERMQKLINISDNTFDHSLVGLKLLNLRVSMRELGRIKFHIFAFDS